MHDMQTYTVLLPLRRNGRDYAPGDTLELWASEAALLVGCRVLKEIPKTGSAADTSAPGGRNTPGASAVKAGAKVALAPKTTKAKSVQAKTDKARKVT